MKTLLTLAAAGWLACGLATASQAQPVGPPTAVNFTSERGVPFGLVLDGQLLAAPVVRALHLDYLAPGQHWAEFSVPTGTGLQRSRVNVWLEPGLETSFVLVQRPGRPAQLRQVSRGPIVPHDYPAWAPGPDDYDGPDQGPYGDNGTANNGNYGGAYPPAGPGGYPTPGNAPTYPGPGNQPNYPAPGNQPAYPGPGNQPTYPGPAGPGYGTPAPSGNYLAPLNPRDAADLAQALSRCPFDEQRLDIAHQALERNSLRSTELAALVRTMTFDKSQKELAKFGYAHVVDPQNFYRVYDAFTFPTSAREVQQALGLPRN